MLKHIKRIIIECILIVAILAVINGVIQQDPTSEDADRYLSLKKRIAALPMCECANVTNLNLEYTFWCLCHPCITVNGKLREEGDTVDGFKIISVTADDIVFLCPEGHALKLYRPTERILIGEPLLEGDIPIGRPLETGLVQQTPEPLPELSSIYYGRTDPVATIGGQNYSVGDTVNGFTIIDNEIWFTDPMGDTAVTPFYDRSYYRKCKQSSEVESDGGDDPQIH